LLGVGAGQFLEKTKEILKTSIQHQKIGERDGNRGRPSPRKEVTKWTNYCGAIGKWTSTDLENN
jgi:hypothetical protein